MRAQGATELLETRAAFSCVLLEGRGRNDSSGCHFLRPDHDGRRWFIARYQFASHGLYGQDSLG